MYISILGCGQFGLALAQVLTGASTKHRIRVWTRSPEKAALFATTHRTSAFPGLTLSSRIEVTADPASLLDADLYFLAVPTPGLRAALTGPLAIIRESLSERPRPVICCLKGVEGGDSSDASGMLQFASHITASCWPGAKVGVLSGPNIAGEMVLGLPAGALVASLHPFVAALTDEAFRGTTLMLEKSPDPLGAEVCGAMKNVVALFCGIADGMHAPDSRHSLDALGTTESLRLRMRRWFSTPQRSKSSLITLTLLEIRSLIERLRGDPATCDGVAGVGDLLLSASNGRNWDTGRRFGLGDSLTDAMAGRTVEGVNTAFALDRLVSTLEMDLPLLSHLAPVLRGDTSPAAAFVHLMEQVDDRIENRKKEHKRSGAAIDTPGIKFYLGWVPVAAVYAGIAVEKGENFKSHAFVKALEELDVLATAAGTRPMTGRELNSLGAALYSVLSRDGSFLLGREIARSVLTRERYMSKALYSRATIYLRMRDFRKMPSELTARLPLLSALAAVELDDASVEGCYEALMRP